MILPVASKTSQVLFLPFCIGGLLAQSPPPEQCRIENVEYAGWKAVQMTNPWIRLAIVPQIGGRLIQVALGGHDYLFVNQQLKGQYFPPEVSAAQKRWFNYGGDKIWPMPEGNNDEQHWPGAVGEPLDSGGYDLKILKQDGATCAVRLTGPPDALIGQQYTRDISIGGDSPVISFHAVMKNISGYPQAWSEQSVSQYNTADAQNPSQPNADFWGFTQVNPRSAYLNSFHVRTGSASTTGYDVRDGLFTVHTSDAGGEVWVDSPGGWLAVVDGATRYAIVERFQYQRGAEYPGEATVIFFTTGQNRRARPPGTSGPDPARPAIHYMEAEVNSPIVKLEPGESYAMDTQWFPTRMGNNFQTAAYAGVVGKRLSVTNSADGMTVTGEFGVFFPGRLQLRFYDRSGAKLGSADSIAVSPLEMVSFSQTLQAPGETARVSLHLIDRNGLDRGPLGEAVVSGLPGFN